MWIRRVYADTCATQNLLQPWNSHRLWRTGNVPKVLKISSCSQLWRCWVNRTRATKCSATTTPSYIFYMKLALHSFSSSSSSSCFSIHLIIKFAFSSLCFDIVSVFLNLVCADAMWFNFYSRALFPNPCVSVLWLLWSFRFLSARQFSHSIF